MTHSVPPVADVPATVWWERRRLRYNLALIVAMFLGYVAYVTVVNRFADVIGRPWVDGDGTVIGNDVDTGGISAMFDCCGAIAALLLANLFYFVGAGVERLIPPARTGTYRKWAWRAGVTFSCLLPFSIALLHLVLCLFFPDWYDRTPIQF